MLYIHRVTSNYPPCKLIRFNIEYTLSLEEEKFPVNFCVKYLQLVSDYIFIELLELVDLNWKCSSDPGGCPRFHLFPRFSRLLEEDGKELLSLNVILSYLLNSNSPVVGDLKKIQDMSTEEFNEFAKQLKGEIVTYPGSKPCSLRVDQIDRQQANKPKVSYCDRQTVLPEIGYHGTIWYQ